MAKTPQETISDLEKGKKNAVEERNISTREITHLAQRAQKLRDSIKSSATPDDKKRQHRATLMLVENDLSTARRDVESQTVLIRRIDEEIAKIRKNSQ